MKRSNFEKQITSLAFVGLLSFNFGNTEKLKTEFMNQVKFEKESWTASSTSGLGDKVRERVEQKIQEMETFKNKRGYLHEVKVTAVGSSNLTVDNNGTSVTVNISDKTQLRRKFWGKSELSEFSTGDKIDVIGKWTDDTKTAINAVLIRNLSIQKKYGVFFGEIKSLSDGKFVMSTIHREDETVTIGASKIINRQGGTLSASDIKVGDRVRVRGLWDSEGKTITEVTEIKNFSLPAGKAGLPLP